MASADNAAEWQTYLLSHCPQHHRLISSPLFKIHFFSIRFRSYGSARCLSHVLRAELSPCGGLITAIKSTKAKAFTPCTPPLWCCTSLIFLTGVVVISTQVQRPVITHPRCCRAIDSSLTTGPHAVTVMILTQVQGPVTIQLCLHSSPSSFRDDQTSSRHHAPRTCRPLGTCASTS